MAFSDPAYEADVPNELGVAPADPATTSALEEIILRVPGVLAVSVSNPQGTPIVQVGDLTDAGPVLKHADKAFVRSFYQTADLTDRVMGVVMRTNLTVWPKHVMLHINSLPLVITVVARRQANVGLMLEVVPDLQDTLAPLQHAAESLQR